MSRGWKPPADPVKDAMASLKDLIFGTGANTRTNKRLSEATQIPPSTISSYRREPRKISMLNAIRLLQAVGASPEEIGTAIMGEVRR